MSEETVSAEEEEQQRDASVQALRDQIDALNAKIQNVDSNVATMQNNAAAAATAPEPYQEVSPEEIRAAVDAGTISEAQGDQIRESQIERRLESNIRQNLNAEIKQQQIVAEALRYQEAYPELADTNSQAFKQVQKEFAVLTEMGLDQNDPKTQYLALRAALGEPTRGTIEKGRPAPYPEVPGHGSAGGDSLAGNAAPDWMQGDLKAYYEKQIDNGYYKGWNDPRVKKELENYAGKFRNKAASAA